MVTKAAAAKAEKERKRRVIGGNCAAGGVVIGLLIFGVHPTRIAIAVTLGIAFVVMLYTVWTCAGLTPTWTKRIVFFAAEVAILGTIGYNNWPRVVVSPAHVTFAPHTSFVFTIRNQTADDVYNVSPVMRLSGTYEPKDFIIRIDTPPPLNLGPLTFPGMVCKDPKGGDVLFPVIQQINAGQEARFVVTYEGTSKPELTEDSMHVTSEPLAQEEAHDNGQGKWQAANDIKLPMPLGNCYFRPRIEGKTP